MTERPNLAERNQRVRLVIAGRVTMSSADNIWIDIGTGGSDLCIHRVEWEAIADKSVSPAMPYWQDGDVVVGYDTTYDRDVTIVRTDGQWVDVTHTYTQGDSLQVHPDERVEAQIDAGNLRAITAEGRPVPPLPTPRVTADATHPAPVEEGS